MCSKVILPASPQNTQRRFAGRGVVTSPRLTLVRSEIDLRELPSGAPVPGGRPNAEPSEGHASGAA